MLLRKRQQDTPHELAALKGLLRRAGEGAGGRPHPGGGPQDGAGSDADTAAAAAAGARNLEKTPSVGAGGARNLRAVPDPTAEADPAGADAPVEEDDLAGALTDEEVADLGKLVEIAEYILVKHAEKKNLHSLLAPLVKTVRESAESLTLLDDEIEEMLLSTETALGRMREMHSSMCEEPDIRPGRDV